MFGLRACHKRRRGGVLRAGPGNEGDTMTGIDGGGVGGGYAGVTAANRLTGRTGVAVTLINPRPAFVERIRLHQLVCGSGDAVADYRGVLAPGVRLVVDTVTRIDADRRRVALAGGGSLSY